MLERDARMWRVRRVVLTARASHVEHPRSQADLQAVQLLEVGGRERRQAAAAPRREAEPDDAPIVRVDLALDEPGAFGPVDELDGAVVAEQQMFRDVTDRRIARMAADGEQQLVLRRGQPGRLGLLL